MNNIVEDMLMHYGMPRRSGRYPFGSGENPYQHTGDFISRVKELRKSGFTFTDEDGKTYTGDTAIAKSMGLSTTQLRTQLSMAKNEQRSTNVATAQALRDKGYSLNEIAEKMGFANDSSVRALLNEGAKTRMNQAKTTAEFLKKQVEEKGMIDVGSGVERELGISREKLKEALYMLELEGYPTWGGGVPQVTNPGQQTNIKVLCPPGTPHKDIYKYGEVNTITEYTSHDGGDTFDSYKYPKSMDSKRLAIRYAEDGGIDKDGVIEIRRGVDDLSLGDSHYAQVRILVDNNRYLKGMAVYSDNMPDGVDVIFNTNKSKGTPAIVADDPDAKQVLKTIKNDPNNPFGALIKAGGQSYYTDENGERQMSLINKTREEGDWGEWAKKLPSQFLSKQSDSLIKKQLKLSIADKMDEYDEISSLENPTVKRSLLQSFADDCDTSAVHLQAAALPNQRYQVILPVTKLKDNEVYAPNYNNGDTVALVRYPHGGIFEIPVLTVNNRNQEARKVIGTSAKDAIGINSKIASQLSGADFDGDTVMVIPCNSANSKVRINSSRPLEGLIGFDPKATYGGKPEGTFKVMKDTQKQMGVISNLITDMTIKGADEKELTRAVRHSMVVIDAEKHKLDYKQSELDNGIAALKKKYQGSIDPDTGRYREGASTLISRAKSETSVPKRKGSPKIDPDTGELVWKTADDLTYVDKKGKTHTRTQQSTKMAEAKDAYELVSDVNSPVEVAYANYANKLKAMANQARLDFLATPKLKYDASAKAKYSDEVKSLNSKLDIALRNAPRERQANLIANDVISALKQDNPGMSKKEIKKASQQALTQARAKVGAKRETIKITDREWEAIQAGAITDNILTQIINNSDIDRLKQLAMPRATNTISVAKQNRIKAMSVAGHTNAEIAKQVGVSLDTVIKYA